MRDRVKDLLGKEDYGERAGSIRQLADNLSAIALQLDNSGLLIKSACRLMGGYYKENQFFRDTKFTPKINKDGFNIIEHYLDIATDSNSVLSNKDKKEVQKACFVLSLELLIDLLRNHKKYDLSLTDIPAIVIPTADAMYSGQKRSLGGQTAKAINQVIKQVENIFREDRQKKGGILNFKN